MSHSAFLSAFTSMLVCLLYYAPVRCEGTESAASSPTTTFEATHGLSQTFSAQPLGEGRMSFGLTGTWYPQEMATVGTPPLNADVTTGIMAFSFGVNPYIDIFGRVAGYGLMGSSPNNKFGLGSVGAGIQATLPLPPRSPLYLGAKLSAIGGTSSDQINTNNSDGYDYFETRNGYDFAAMLLQTLCFGSENGGIKLHFNEGTVMSLQTNRDMLLLLGAGIEGILHPVVVLGIEFHSRTFLQNIDIQTDPLWLTPSVQVRTPYYFNVTFGADISVAKDRTDATMRSLEPYRLFGGIAFSFDLLAGKRKTAAEKEKQEAAEKEGMIRTTKQAQARADSIAHKAQEDSIAGARAREAERMRADSLAAKARQDSITLVEVTRKLAEEKSKRSDAEKQLLSTGLLILDACYFETGKANVSINSYPYLNIIGKMLVKYPKLQIEIDGHTDNVGKLATNMTLSQARADAVRTYLIQVAPELSSRLTSRGFGPTQPKASNSTADGRKMNRRTELQVLNREVLKEYNQ